MIKVVGTIANGGKEVKPRLAKAIIDSETGEKTDAISYVPNYLKEPFINSKSSG